MTERETLPSKIVAQDVVMTTTQRGSLVARGFQAVENSKQKALTKNNEVNTAEEQYRLGVKYDSGDGVPQDYEETVKWYRLAADQGHVDAQYNLGLIYDNGRGVPQDSEEAVKWYRLAADQGDADCQFHLGVMYHIGQGVPVDFKEAVKWYRLAADQSDTDAQYNLDNMDKLTSKEVRFAREIGLGHLTNDPEALAVARAQYRKNLDAKMDQVHQSYVAQKIKDEMPTASLKSNTNTGSIKQEETLNQPMQAVKMQKQTEDPKDTDSNDMSLIEWLRTLPPGGKLTIKLPGEK